MKILRFEEKRPKPPSRLFHAVKTAPVSMVSTQVHRKISETEQDNVGAESAHRLVRVWRRIPTAPKSCASTGRRQRPK